MERIEELALHYRCEYCLAGIDVWCRTLKGARATSLHTCRTDPLYLARGDGIQEASALYKPVGMVTYQSNYPPNQSSTGVA